MAALRLNSRELEETQLRETMRGIPLGEDAEVPPSIPADELEADGGTTYQPIFLAPDTPPWAHVV